MENEKLEQKLEDTEQEEMLAPREHYVPRPRWQLALAWFLLAVMLLGVAGYYYWIAFPG